MSDDASSDSEPGIEELDRVKRFAQLGPPRTAASPRLKLPPYPGNPNYGPIVQLFCRTGYNVALFTDKKVKGVAVDRHPNAVLELTSVNVGEVRMKGVATSLYLAMNQDGHLYGEADGTSPRTVFVEYLFGQYNVYLSKHWAHLGWYAAIKKSGKAKPAKQTRWGQKAVQFLPVRI